MFNRQETIDQQDEFIRTTVLANARIATQRARERDALRMILSLPVGASISAAQEVARKALER